MLGWLFGSGEDRGSAAWRTLMAGLRVAWERVQAAKGYTAGGTVADPDPLLTAIFTNIASPNYNMANAYPDANEAELRLAAQLPRAALEAKGTAYLGRAVRMAVPGIDDLKAEFATARAVNGAAGEDGMREVLIEVLRATHTRYADRRSNRNARNEIAMRLAFFAVVVVIAPLVCVAVYWGLQKGSLTFFQIAGKFHLISLIYCGAVGAIFSRLIAFQSYEGELTYEDLHRNYRRRMIFVRVFIGGIAAFVVYYLIAAGIVGGELFPGVENNTFGTLWTSAMVQDATQRYTMPMPNFAKLVIWCVLAGFSERFIPDRLAQVETNAGNSVRAN